MDRPSDDLKLMRPDTPPADNPTLVPYVLVDEVNYASSAPWTSAANQQSNTSLSRSATSVYGKEPSNWVGVPATPGKSDLAAVNLVHGDFSFDGQSGPADVAAMFAALADIPSFEATHGLTDADWRFIGDMNGDHVVNNLDLQGLLTLLISSSGGGASGGGSESANDAGFNSPARTATVSVVSPVAAVAADAVATVSKTSTASAGIAGSSSLPVVPRFITNVDAVASFETPRHWGGPADASKPPELVVRNITRAVDQVIFGLQDDRLQHPHRDRIASAGQLDDFFASLT